MDRRVESDFRYKNIDQDELAGLSRPESVARIYSHDAAEEFLQSVKEHGSYPLEVLDAIVAQDMVTSMRLYIEELQKERVI